MTNGNLTGSESTHIFGQNSVGKFISGQGRGASEISQEIVGGVSQRFSDPQRSQLSNCLPKRQPIPLKYCPAIERLLASDNLRSAQRIHGQAAPKDATVVGENGIGFVTGQAGSQTVPLHWNVGGLQVAWAPYASMSDYNANIHAAYEIFSRDGHAWSEWACKP